MAFPPAHPSLLAALTRREYLEPTPVQAAVLAADVADRDLLVSAQTGSGKTVAFGLALAPTLLGEEPRFTKAGAPLALIVAPTRELALQVHRELTWLYNDTGARITTCVGGMDPRRESNMLASGVHIVVGTPGRLCDHLERGALVLTQLRAVVLDEADEMLDMGFREDLQRLLDASSPTRRTLMFSATIPKDIATLAKRYQKQAMRIATSSDAERHVDIEYQAIPIVPRERDLAVVNLLRFHDAAGALVFCATRDGVTHLAANLNERGFAVAALSGELSQRERNQALQALRDGRARVCVATDVAARGLDLPDLGLVIHADLPQNKQVLVHRSGRTGRAGKHGLAILLVPDPARRYAERMLGAAHIDIKWVSPPSAEDIRAKDQELLVREIGTLAAETAEEDRAVARSLLAERSAEELVAALVHLRREARPSPEELSVPASMRPRRDLPGRGDVRDRGDQRPRNSDPGDRIRDPRAPMQHQRRDRPEPRAHGDAPPRPARTPRSHEAGEPADLAERADPGERADRGRADRGDRAAGGVWFTVNVGRIKKADPKWLIPLLCRRGGITSREIGAIQVLARETRVEIAPSVSARFAEAVRRPDPKDKMIHIEPLDAPT
jgi:ATP-dependent RNA helicase DeaD